MLIRLRTLLMIMLAIALGIACYLAHGLEARAHALKADEMELSSINYGLFNPDKWKEALKDIVAKEILDFELEGKDREVLKVQLEGILRKVFEDLNRTVQSEKGLKGVMRKAVIKAVVPMDAIQEDIPVYAGNIVAEVDKPANRKKLKGFVLKQLDSLAATTSGKIDMHLYDEVMERHQFTDTKQGISSLRHQRAILEDQLSMYGWGMIGIVVLMVVLLVIGSPGRPLDLAVLVVSATTLLVTSLLMPMIDIEARISSFQLSVLAGQVTFTDQILFYESRSILQVIWLLLEENDLGLLLVAALVFCFSVAFPFTKLLFSFITSVKGRLPRNKVLRFFVLKSAKWSMADVLVVAMFMTYLGLNGVVNGQLSNLRDLSSVRIMTTNQSGLEFGFYLFTGFVLLGLVISTLVERSLKDAAAVEQ